jgi:alpha-L-arabinofuranosidase
MKAVLRSTMTTSPQPARLRSLQALLLVAALAAAASGLRAADATLEATLTLDPSQPGAVISPYLYGQFIEHLGRCIHDGIWAEKLRDRKFFQPLDKSGWQVVQAADAQFDAYLDPAGAFAGEHSLAPWRRDQNSGGCGLAQKDIGVIAGKDYVGYAWVACANGEPGLEATLAWGHGTEDRHTVRLNGLSREYRRVPFRFHADWRLYP